MNVVTGAFGYIGRYIARHLLGLGEQVKTVTTHPDKPNPFGNAVEAFPYNFDRPNRLIASLSRPKFLTSGHCRSRNGLYTPIALLQGSPNEGAETGQLKAFSV